MSSISAYRVPLFADLMGGILDLIYPPLCLLCETRLDESREQICHTCLESFRLINEPHINFSVPGPLHIRQAWALFDFDPPIQSLIHHLKYAQRRKPVLRVLDRFESDILRQLPKAGYDWVIPIPLHPRKYRERGYNQIADMAYWVALRVQGKVGNTLARRKRYTQTQTKLNAEERQANVKGAFQLDDKQAVDQQDILIVDDVLTTGATANALAQCLKSAGAANVDLLTLSTPRLGEA